LKKFGRGVSAACYLRKKNSLVPGVLQGQRFIRVSRRKNGEFQSALVKRAGRYAQSGCAELVGLNTRVDSPEIPGFAQWEQNMITYGRIHCEALKGNDLNGEQKLAATYYDAESIFHQIGDYTGDPYWRDCAQAAEGIYGKEYVVENDGRVPAYWNFAEGLRRAWQINGDAVARRGVVLLATRASYAPDETELAETRPTEYSREVAYTILAYLEAEKVGEGRRARLLDLEEQALSHLNQWTVAQTAPYVRPFMVALTAQALIRYNEVSPDPRILPAVKTALDWIWIKTWLPERKAFMYTDRETSTGGMEPAGDLNLLIAPAFAWVYMQTGIEAYGARGDQIFEGGVGQAYVTGAKQFNQNYRWSFDFVKWRNSVRFGAASIKPVG
jgi:hypothetical protein